MARERAYHTHLSELNHQQTWDTCMSGLGIIVVRVLVLHLRIQSIEPKAFTVLAHGLVSIQHRTTKGDHIEGRRRRSFGVDTSAFNNLKFGTRKQP